MATQEEIASLRALVGETSLTDQQLGAILDASQCENEAAAKVWGQKAGEYASLVNISEAGSSRSMGDLHKNALDMARYYADLGCPGEGGDDRTGRTQTRAIVRP